MKRIRKGVLYFLLGIIVLSVIVNIISPSKPIPVATTSSADLKDAVQKALDTTVKHEAPHGKWAYGDQNDAMTDKNTHFAILEGDNTLSLEFPYNSVTHRIQLSKKAGGKTVVVLQTFKGQFNSSIDGMPIQVRFDDGKPVSFSCSEAADGDPSVLFINDANTFISRFRKSNYVIIRAMFFNNGYQDMYYSPVGLEWK